MTKGKILITGGAGAIGFQLAKFLYDQGREIYIADNFIRSERDTELQELISKDNVHEIKIDLSDVSQYPRLPDDVEYIYHLAAFNGTQNFYERSFQVLLHSTIPTINLIQWYAGNKMLKRFIYAGSSEAYACSITRFGWEVPTNESVPLGIEDPLNPRWSYGGSKMHGELACVAANAEFDFPFTVLRYHNIYGPRMGDKHLVPDFIERAKYGKYELFGYEDTRSFLYVLDAVRATVAVAECEDASNQIVHLGSDEEIKIIDLANIMMKIMGSDDEITLHPSPSGSVKRRSPDITKLKKLTGFTPQYSLEQGLKATIEYYMGEQ